MARVRPETQYTWSAGSAIAYQVFGDGPVELVVAAGPASQSEHFWQEPTAVRFYERLASFARVAIFDHRGTGASDPLPGPPTLEQQMEDLDAVIAAVGFDTPAVYAESDATRMVAMWAATHPDRLSRLVAYGASAVGAAVLTPELSERVLQMATDMWGQGELTAVFAPSMADDERFRQWIASMERHAASPGMARKIIRMNMETDVRPVLSTIRTPTLVLHRRGDTLTPVEVGRQFADAIPDARFVELDGIDNLSLVGDSEAILNEVEEFLTGELRHHPTNRVLATVLFTDIVGATERAAGMGDRRWYDLIAEHDRRVRRELVRWRGEEVKTVGDGFVATFDGPARGIRCATSIRDRVDELGLRARAGLHTGEIDVAEDDIRGMTVHIGARVGARAGPGEVLVSGTVKDLVVGSGLDFKDRGEHELKGVPGVWRLYAVDG
jgi:class 3 adenylate cyclase